MAAKWLQKGLSSGTEQKKCRKSPKVSQKGKFVETNRKKEVGRNRQKTSPSLAVLYPQPNLQFSCLLRIPPSSSTQVTPSHHSHQGLRQGGGGAPQRQALYPCFLFKGKFPGSFKATRCSAWGGFWRRGNVASLNAKNRVSGSWEASQEIGEGEGGSGASNHWGQEQSSGDPVGFHNSSLSWPL